MANASNMLMATTADLSLSVVYVTDGWAAWHNTVKLLGNLDVDFSKVK